MLRTRSAVLVTAALLTAGLAGPVAATETTPTPDPAVTTAPTTPSAPAFRNSCSVKRATLEKSVEGTPSKELFHPGATEGLYVWHTAKGWRVRLTHPQTTVTVGDQTRPHLIEVRGRITASRPISNVRTIRLEDKQAGEWVAVQRPKRRIMDFRFVNGGFIDGINFNAGCAGKLTFAAWKVEKNVDGTIRQTPINVFVGRDATPVTTVSTPLQLNTAAYGPDANGNGRSRFTVLRTPVA